MRYRPKPKRAAIAAARYYYAVFTSKHGYFLFLRKLSRGD